MRKVLGNVMMLFVFAALIIIELYLHGVFDFLEPLDTVESLNDFTKYVEKQLEDGTEEFDIYAKNLSESEIKGVNRKLDGFFGVVKTYAIIRKRSDGTMKIHVKLLRSDNWWVYKKLVEKKEITFPNSQTQQMYAKAEEILHSLIKEGMSDMEKEQNIHDYIVKNCVYAEEYVNDHTKNSANAEQDNVYKAYGVLIEKKAVCNGYSEAMYLLLSAAGLQCKMVVGTADGQDHAWNEVKVDGEWYQVDATWDDPTPDQKDVVQYLYFNLTDRQLEDTHIWDQKNYPTCENEQYNYFVYYQKICQDYPEFVTKVNKAIKKKENNISLLVKDYKKENYNMSFVLDQHNNVKKASYSTSHSNIGTVITLSISY